MSVKLGVNIDHVATLRQARHGSFPDPLEAAKVVEAAGAFGIVVHLREDRRHIQDHDVMALKQELKINLNLEMAATPEMVELACRLRPDSVCLVPERREELTTEGGLDIVGRKKELEKVVPCLTEQGILVSLFIEPNPEHVRLAKTLGAQAVELHTGSYANAAQQRWQELQKLQQAGDVAVGEGLLLNAGHGLDYDNVGPVAQIPGMNELNIGFSIISRALFVGLDRAVQEMLERITQNAEFLMERP